MVIPDPVIATKEEVDAAALGGGESDVGGFTVVTTTAGLLLSGPAGAVVGSIAGAVLENLGDGEDSEEHDKILARALTALNESASESARLRVQHLDDEDTTDLDSVEESETTYNVFEGVDGYPDITYTDPGGPTGNLAVEVEHSRKLTGDPKHVVDQLQKYRGDGCSTVLVVEAGAASDAHDWLVERDEVPSRTYVAEGPALGRFVRTPVEEFR